MIQVCGGGCRPHRCTEPQLFFFVCNTLRAGGERECREAAKCDGLNVLQVEAVALVFVAQRPPQA